MNRDCTHWPDGERNRDNNSYADNSRCSWNRWQCGSGMRAGARLSDDAVRHFHSQLDSEAYGDIVRDSDEAFQNSANRFLFVLFEYG
jgi:hypothetical protein